MDLFPMIGCLIYPICQTLEYSSNVEILWAIMQIRVFAHNIVESSEVTSGITKLGDYELHDLILLE